METTAPERGHWLRRTCRDGDVLPAWYLLMMPLFLAAIDSTPDLASAMTRAGAVLGIAASGWAVGFGRAQRAAETAFAVTWAALWVAATGVFVAARGLQQEPWGLAATAVALATGGGLLAWARRSRSRREVLDTPEESPFSPRRRRGLWLLLVAAVTGAGLLLIEGPAAFHYGDGAVAVLAVGFYAALAVRGRAARHGREES